MVRELALPRLDPYSTNDQELQLMIDRDAGGWRDMIYICITRRWSTEFQVFWRWRKTGKKTGLNIICAAGAHLDPIRAVKSAVHELAGMMLTLDEKFEANQEEYVRMLQ